MMNKATLAGGCFWCLEAIFQELKGVESVQSGFSGGFIKNPAYKEVITGRTGHAEVVHIEYDPQEIDYHKLLEVFFKIHDPTTLNRQGNDVGTQYRSAIFTHNNDQLEIATHFINALSEAQVFDNPIVTKVETFEAFYPAEDYHSNYFNLHQEEPYCNLVIQPKVQKFLKHFREDIK